MASFADRGLAPPPGAVLASFQEGVEFYVWDRPNGHICLVELPPNGPGGAVCAAPAAVEQGGVPLITPRIGGAPARIAVLVPNGVSGVTFTRSDGTSVSVPAQDNVVSFADPKLASAHYTVPGGASETVAVPAEVRP